MSDSIGTAYEPTEVEAKWYRRWLDKGCFHGNEESEAEPYSIVIPPPNVTGVLHLGHVLNNTIQDVLARRARMKGCAVLWLPGTDHAGIATQSVVERRLREEEKLTRHDLGREMFVERVEQWKNEHGGIIIKQLKRLGASCDWERERYTQDPGYCEWVLKVFTELFEQGLIYRGKKMVNWCPKTQTALSDEEVIKRKSKGSLYYMRYEVVDFPGEYLEIATTRPETLMGDTAVAVHPDDERYKKYIGKKARRPFPEAEIPIIGDSYIDMEFGTGVLKVTPAHDKADYEIGLRHRLPVMDVFHPDGTLNALAGPDFEGLSREKAREKAAEKLEGLGLLIRREPYENEVGYSERGNVPIEPRLSSQWFLRYPSVPEATRAVAQNEIVFRPERWKKTFGHWMENIEDWCISRQLWWGHRIPVWYPKDRLDEIRAEKISERDLRSIVHVGTAPPEDPEDWVQEEDVLDTWFSSWLWPFATMTDPVRAKFFPTTDLVTGPDIIFFWVARMIMASYTFTGTLPFRNVFFTSLIRDKQGRKLSKSLGNSPDCLELLDSYGADGVRFGLLRIAPSGSDVRYDEDRMREGRNFATKLWNASRYRLMQKSPAPDVVSAEYSPYALDIFVRLEEMEARLEGAYADYKFNDIANHLYEFFWSHFCDWYLESAKSDFHEEADPARRAATLEAMDAVMRRFLMHLHPYMPHITEELWERFGFPEMDRELMLETLPEQGLLKELGIDFGVAGEASVRARAVYDLVGRARNLKAAYRLAANKNVRLIVRPRAAWLEEETEVVRLLAGAAEVLVDPDYEAPRGTPAALSEAGEVFLPLEGLIDVDEERKRLTKETGKIEKELEKVNRKLSNTGFLEKAKKEVVEENEQRRRDWMEKLTQLRDMLQALDG